MNSLLLQSRFSKLKIPDQTSSLVAGNAQLRPPTESDSPVLFAGNAWLALPVA